MLDFFKKKNTDNCFWFPLAPYAKSLAQSKTSSLAHSKQYSWKIVEKESHFLDYMGHLTRKKADTMTDTILFLILYIKIASVWIFLWCTVTESFSLINSWKVLVWSQYINLKTLSCSSLILLFNVLLLFIQKQGQCLNCNKNMNEKVFFYLSPCRMQL